MSLRRPPPDEDGGHASRRRRMLDAERRRGEIRDERVFAALDTVPREAFVEASLVEEAYDEHALPIAEGQTISQPYVVALMTDAARLRPDDRVLEVGTGSGYQAAVLSRLVERVVTVERFAALATTARERLARLGFTGIEVHVGDGTLGWPERAPYDAIVVTAGGPSVPPTLVDQLAPGGRLVMPVGPPHAQRLLRVTRATAGDRLTTDDLGAVAFVPLVGREGWPDDG